jgi:hypothetical protein
MIAPVTTDTAILPPAEEAAAMWRLPQVQAARRQAAALWRIGYGTDVPAEAEPGFEQAMDEYVTNYLLKGAACDTDYPRFVRNFQSPAEISAAGLPGARMGGDNPDNIYRLAAIAHDTGYRVTGRVAGRSAPDVSFSLMGNWGTSVGIATIGLHELEVDADSRFTLIIDDQPAGTRRNHLTSAPHAKFLFVRDSLMDWAAETALELAIERIGTPARPPLTIEEKAARACFRLTEDIPLYYWFTRMFSGRPVNSMTVPVKVSSFGGLATQTSSMGRLSLKSDEAAIIRFDPAGATYVSLVDYDWWFRSIDVDSHQSSLTAATAAPDADGWISCVACGEDPGVANWIDTGGFGETLPLVRWQGLPSEEVRGGPIAEIRIVKRDRLDVELPDAERIDPAERARRLAVRKAALLGRAPF